MIPPTLPRTLPTIMTFVRTVAFSFVVASVSWAAGQEDLKNPFTIPPDVGRVLERYCGECHGADANEGDFTFSGLSRADLKSRLELLNKAQDQLFFRLMPPPDARQPNDAERTLLAGWLRTELRRHGASTLDDKLRYPDYGNYVPHEALFDAAASRAPAYTPARRWLVSPQIFHERIVEIFRREMDARERESFVRPGGGFYGVSNPITLPDHSGVRYYDLATLDGGHLLAMLANAQWISHKQLRAARIKKGEIGANQFDDQRDRWYPKTTPAPFEKIVLQAAAPTDEQIADAVQAQFARVLQRPADADELKKYVELTRAAIETGGNVEGLRHMLTAVLLESEFLYRLEFGAGDADEHGRKKLSPREASYAIAYALGDRGPDDTLRQAAEAGRLTEPADYRREVLRLLDDPNYFRGPIDKNLSGLQHRVTSHPRIVRFFREFFGYPNALKVFKDGQRSGGYYRNPDRGSTQTPGFLINEADMVVADVVEADRAVFETLLTTDKFYVYHNLSNDAGAKLVDGWRQAYEALKNTNWREDPDQVVAEHAELIKRHLDPRGIKGRNSAAHDNSLTRLMNHFDQTFGRGRTPFTVFPWAHGNQFWYSQAYNLPKTPGQGGRYGDGDDLDYPPVQPFPLPHRKGLLTHPAWLVAHSGNFQTDPIRRGRWIREKLLAGRVPDVPITVDAQVPEDPHKTLRERVEAVTAKSECRKCHQHMNPLGYPFESFDDFGRYRTEESLEHPDNLIKNASGKNDADVYKTKPVVATGSLDGIGDPRLAGEVRDPFELIDRLAASERVRQSIIRHAFRFFLGRNEMLSDAPTLIDADQAYVTSGGSFRAVIVSLLTSDSFLYRKESGN